MIVVTPYVVHAIDPSQIVRPDQNFEDAGYPQAWFLGRVDRIYSTSGALQPTPGYGENRLHHPIDASFIMIATEEKKKRRRGRSLAGGEHAQGEARLFRSRLWRVRCRAAGQVRASPGDFEARHPIALAYAPTT